MKDGQLGVDEWIDGWMNERSGRLDGWMVGWVDG